MIGRTDHESATQTEFQKFHRFMKLQASWRDSFCNAYEPGYAVPSCKRNVGSSHWDPAYGGEPVQAQSCWSSVPLNVDAAYCV